MKNKPILILLVGVFMLFFFVSCTSVPASTPTPEPIPYTLAYDTDRDGNWEIYRMGADAGVKPHEANQMISDAIDLLVQIGIRHEVRRVTAISNIAKDPKNGDAFFEPIYRYIEELSDVEPCWEKLGELI